MRLSLFLNKKVFILLLNGWTYSGTVVDANDDSIILIDRKNEKVFLSHQAIQSIREVLS